MVRMATAEAAAAAAHEDARLVPLTIEHYCPAALPGYEVVFPRMTPKRVTPPLGRTTSNDLSSRSICQADGPTSSCVSSDEWPLLDNRLR